MRRSDYYARVIPALGILYVILMFLLDWQTKAVVAGALVVSLSPLLAPVFTKDQQEPSRPPASRPD